MSFIFKRKCEQYWPTEDTKKYGDIEVSMVNCNLFEEWTHRYFKVCRGEEQRILEHFQLSNWPDCGVPVYPQYLVTYVTTISRMRHDTPTVVHCRSVSQLAPVYTVNFSTRGVTSRPAGPQMWAGSALFGAPNKTRL